MGTAAIRAGALDTAWADRFEVRVAAYSDEDEVQHDQVMENVYGDLLSRYRSVASVVRWEKAELGDSPFGARVAVSHVARAVDLDDSSTRIWSWDGEVVGERRSPGETGTYTGGTDRTQWGHDVLGHATLFFEPSDEHSFVVNATPSAAWRSGRDRLRADEALDPTALDRRNVRWSTGAQYTYSPSAAPIEATGFVRYAGIRLEGEEQRAVTGETITTTTTSSTQHVPGGGAGLKYQFSDQLFVRGSWERSVRLPETDELFGDGAFVQPNFDLNAETSHNLNIGLDLDGHRTRRGDLDAEVTVYGRFTDDLMVLLPVGSGFLKWSNVATTRAIGGAASARWADTLGHFEAGGTLTLERTENRARTGVFATNFGSRIPNQPWLYGSAFAMLSTSDLLPDQQQLRLRWDLTWTHRFYRTWESSGIRSSRQYIPAQVVSDISVTWVGADGKWSAAFRMENIGDRRTFDQFGVQKPGRSYYTTLTAHW